MADSCRKCGEPIDEQARAFKRKLCEKLGKEYTEPKACSDCAIDALLSFAFGEDDDGTGD